MDLEKRASQERDQRKSLDRDWKPKLNQDSWILFSLCLILPKEAEHSAPGALLEMGFMGRMVQKRERPDTITILQP